MAKHSKDTGVLTPRPRSSLGARGEASRPGSLPHPGAGSRPAAAGPFLRGSAAPHAQTRALTLLRIRVARRNLLCLLRALAYASALCVSCPSRARAPTLTYSPLGLRPHCTESIPPPAGLGDSRRPRRLRPLQCPAPASCGARRRVSHGSPPAQALVFPDATLNGTDSNCHFLTGASITLRNWTNFPSVPQKVLRCLHTHRAAGQGGGGTGAAADAGQGRALISRTRGQSQGESRRERPAQQPDRFI